MRAVRPGSRAGLAPAGRVRCESEVARSRCRLAPPAQGPRKRIDSRPKSKSVPSTSGKGLKLRPLMLMLRRLNGAMARPIARLSKGRFSAEKATPTPSRNGLRPSYGLLFHSGPERPLRGAACDPNHGRVTASVEVRVPSEPAAGNNKGTLWMLNQYGRSPGFAGVAVEV